MYRWTTIKRFSSTVTVKPTPSKTHLHQPIPSATFPSGYVLTGLHAGVKKNASAYDVGLILSTSDRPTSAAACFTKNVFKAAPVLVSEHILTKNGGRARAVVVNSGCANAVTGKQGMEDAWAMVKETDALLAKQGKGEGEHETLVMSTGVIGQTLPISKILSAIRSQQHQSPSSSLESDFKAWERTAHAFMTTDTFPKLRAKTFSIRGQEYSLAGMDKGAGMIHPDMGPPRPASAQLHATLLGCILTDAPVSPPSLQKALTYAVERSFNSISVDGDMSTNDTIIVLANGAKGDGKEIDEMEDKEAYEIFKQELTEFAIDLAKLVVRDGEGATKFVTVNVKVCAIFPQQERFTDILSAGRTIL